MRKIKFRAWNKEKNIMCYENEDNSARYLDGWDASDIQVINQTLNSDFTKETYDFMEFTGLKDKNGKEIYEGDILRKPARDEWEETSHISYECWFDNRTTFEYGWHFSRAKFHGNLCGGQGSMPMEWADKLEVIGNIYENPELLEE